MFRIFEGVVFGLATTVLLAADSQCQDPNAPPESPKIAQIRTRAQQGCVREQIELASAYLTGNGVPQSSGEAARWYLKAALSGDPGAENEMGYFYLSGIGVPKDADRAMRWFQLASAGGSVWAKVNLGVSYFRGQGVKRDVVAARHYFQEAAGLGVGLGATYLGVMDYLGVDGPPDKTSAQRWFQMGAKLHDPEAAYDLAVLIYQGDAATRDTEKALALLRFSAGKGYVPGKHALGLFLVNHPELEQSLQETRQVLEEASNAGNWKSSILLGILARDGRRGVPEDASRAYYYFRLAVLQGGEESGHLLRHDLDSLEQKLTPEQRDTLAAQAQEWVRQHPVALMFVLDSGAENRDFPRIAATDMAALP